MDRILDTPLNGHTTTLIPRGVADYFWDTAAKRRTLEDTLLSVYKSWGYGYIIPPTLEYADTFETGSSAMQNTSNMVRFLDHDGQSLALRYDMTVAIARLVGTRLHDAPMPQRYCYVGNIFRNREYQPGRLREFGQAGVELVGANTTAADAEVLALTARSLQVAGLHDFRLALGQLRFIRGILEELALTPTQESALTQAIERRSEPELHRFLKEANLSKTHQETIQRLLFLNGPDSLETLNTAQAICLNQTMEDAVDNLRAIHVALTAYDFSQYIHLDLTEVSDMGYYTGIRFMAYVPGLGSGIAGGGRYDNLIGVFGPSQPAVGVALGLERILLALQSTNGAAQPSLENHVMVSSELDGSWVHIVGKWRSAGIRAVVDVNGRRGSELWLAAQAKGIPCALTWTNGGFDLYDNQSSPDKPSKHIGIEESTAYLISKLG
ncbi:MAG: ATP phosphoribosyltransferase regulatory subunit [Chloroflexota bacterium]